VNKTEKKALSTEIPPLKTFYVYMTKGCNLACRHCWLSPEFQKGGSTGGHLPFEMFKMAVEQAKILGLRNVKLTGGEPLLHPDFITFVDYLSAQNLGVSIETNGVLITEALAKLLKEKISLGFISVSLDGAKPETHDAFRGVSGSFEKTCNAIRHLIWEGFKPQVIMSIHSGNVNEIEEEVRLVEKLGAGSVKFNLVQIAGRGKLMQKRHEILDINRLVEIGTYIENKLQKNVSIPLYYSWPMAFHSLRRLREGNTGNCAIFNILGILSSGQLAMCGIGLAIPELVYGQIGVDSIDAIWIKNPLLNELREVLPGNLEGICGNCIFKNQCLGSCVADNYHQSHRLTAPYWFCDQALEEGLFPQTRLIDTNKHKKII
jgi:SynChlorMet cassette radical SAM/SPASM protein ScmF